MGVAYLSGGPGIGRLTGDRCLIPWTWMDSEFGGVRLVCGPCLTCHCPACAALVWVWARLPRLPLSTASGSSCSSGLVSAPLATKFLSLVVEGLPSSVLFAELNEPTDSF